jgi:hypothetical protein
MRITPDILLKIAQDFVAQRTQADRSIVAAYLHGSVLGKEPLLGNATDIDLFFIYTDDVRAEREIIRITDDVHFDIVNAPRRLFRQVRELRTHPWWGPTFYGCKILHDPQHFIDFIQASVRGQYERPDHVLARSRPLLQQARQIWLSFGFEGNTAAIARVERYLQALAYSANAIALLTGNPLTERRFLLDFALRAEAIGRPGLMAGFMGLLNATHINQDIAYGLIENWSMAFELAQKHVPPPELSAGRKNYYLHVFDAFVSHGNPSLLFWPLLRTWTNLIALIPPDTTSHQIWQDHCEQMGLGGSAFLEKLAALDAFLDLIEETIDAWAEQQGA